MRYTITCPCLFGLESELQFEVRKIGGENIVTEDGRISFEGDAAMIAKANLCLSTAERVLLQVGTFSAVTFEELFQGVKALPWEQYIPENGCFPVTGHTKNSTLASLPDCQAIIKKAMADRLSAHYGVNWCDESGAMYQVRFILLKNKVSIYLDTTGIPLHKRGYRATSTSAPIKETLAAGIVRLARVRSDSQLYDPFCGSGTLLIEGAMRALNIAPGVGRHFVCETWENIMDPKIFQQAKEQCYLEVNRQAGFMGYGSDIDPEAVRIAMMNGKKEGLAAKIKVEQRDIKDFSMGESGGIVICNPPYGERLLEQNACREIYRTMGRVLDYKDDRTFYIITSDDEFETYFDRRADKKRKLYNGMIKCNLYMYYKTRGKY